MIITPPLSIKDTQKGLLDKKFTAVDLVDSYLDKINKTNSDINAVLTISEEKAYDKARNIDRLIDQLGNKIISQYPLFGVSIIYKDNFLTKGVRTTAASKVLQSYVPNYSATVVNKLEEAGVIPIGKANCDAWAHGSSGENSDFGATKNPWNQEYVPGGSSSGSGASLAANYALITTGTDTCGSIRLPANYCYSYGFKPTYGAVPRYGIIAMASSLDCVGHLARSISDIKRVFEVTRGIDGHDSTMKETTYQQPKARLRIGVPKEFFIKGLDKEIEKNINSAIEIFKKEGVEIKQISIPTSPYGISVYYIIQPAEVSSNLARYDGVRYGNSRDFFGAEAKRRIMLGTYVLSAGYYDAYYLKAMKVRSKIINEVDKAFEEVDAIISPVAPTPPFKLGEKTSDPLKMYLTDIFAATANMAGIPSVSIPFGFSKDKLPLGFQLMAPRFMENTIFSLSELFERTTNYKPKIAK